MRKQKLILILLSIIFLSSCDSFPTIPPKERCVVVLEPEQYCRCHMYQWTSQGIGRITESTDHDIMYCNKLIGFNAADSISIYEWQESIRLWLLRHKK